MVPDPLIRRVPDAFWPPDSTKVRQDIEPDDHDGIGPEFPGELGDGRDPPGRDSPVGPEPLG